MSANINDVGVKANQRLFPEITFTCNGFIAEWIVGAKLQTNISSGQLPELQIWRSMDGANYQKVGFNLLTSNSHRVNYLLNVYEYAPNPPLKFQKGDILGVYQPVDSKIELSYQINDGPINYELDYTDAANIVPLSMQYDYPLVTVKITTSGSFSSLKTFSMSSINVSQSVMSNSHEQAVLPIFAYPIITVAVILIAVAVSITLIIILKFIWSCKNLANMQTDQNLCYAVNSQ